MKGFSMHTQKIMGVIACAIIVTGALAQVAPVCCKYLFQWPPGGNPPPQAGGPCSGKIATVCENDADSGYSNDPFMKRRYGWRWANCYVYQLGEFAYFARGECAGGPPPGGVLIATLPDGRCCWIVGSFSEDAIPQLFQIWDCADPCLTAPPEEN